MNKITIKSLTMHNFKGVRSMTIDFSETKTDIYGDNGTGKSTIFDAFLWLLFGKDASDRKDFEIKTLDENNNVLHRLDHEVAAVIRIDNGSTAEDISIKRVYKEKWTKKRGELTPVFDGHETTYFYNEVPCNQSEYNAKIAAILNESVFKMVTNTNYFNLVKWQDRRNVLMQLAGNVSDLEVLKGMEGTKQGNYEDLIFALNKKTVDEYKREIAAKKKTIKDELVLIPSRIDEAKRALPEEFDDTQVKITIGRVSKDIESIDNQLMNKTQAAKDYQAKIQGLISNQSDLKKQCMEIEYQIKQSGIEAANNRKSLIAAKIRESDDKIANMKSLKKNWEEDVAAKKLKDEKVLALRQKWAEVNAKEIGLFNEQDFCCPTCKREFEAGDIELKKKELLDNFYQAKSTELNAINQQGKDIVEELNILNARIGNHQASFDTLVDSSVEMESNIKTLVEDNERLCATETEQIALAIKNDAQYKALQDQIKELEWQINAPQSVQDQSYLIDQKKALNTELDLLKIRLSTKQARAQGESRIKELESAEKTMSSELAQLEGLEFSIEKFVKHKIDAVETAVNKKFKLVKFKLFEDQINGGQVESCTTLINGVPFPDANTASKIKAGIDIINVISEHYGTIAPIFIDNRESVFNIPDSPSQIINLIASKEDKALRLELA